MASLYDCIVRLNAKKVDSGSDASFNTITVANRSNLNGDTVVGANFKVNGFYVATARNDSAWYNTDLGTRGYQLCQHNLGEAPDMNGVEFRVVNAGSQQLTNWSGSLWVGDNNNTSRPWYGGYSEGAEAQPKQLAST